MDEQAVDRVPELSIVVPTLNEAHNIGACLRPLQVLRQQGRVEVIVVDGGSKDETVAHAAGGADRIFTAARGRARQMNAGAERARGLGLLFLHADSRLSARALAHAMEALKQPGVHWGRFDVSFSAPRFMFRVIAFLMNARSRLTGIATGDQGLFFRRAFFRDLGGFADIPLMEDVELSARACRRHRPRCLSFAIHPSPRKWEQHGIWSTIFLMWRLRLAYALGAEPDKLHARYYQGGPMA